MMLNRINRKHAARSIKTYAHRFIYGNHDYGDFRQQLQRKGAYAVTSIVVRLDEPAYTEKDLERFVTEFYRYAPLYMNLKSLHIDAPYSAIKGQMLMELMQVESCFNDLRIDSWTFHSPLEEQWKGVPLQKIKLNMCDGIVFPFAFNNMLTGLCQHQNAIKHIDLVNLSPHSIEVNRKLLPSRAFVNVHGLTMINNINKDILFFFFFFFILVFLCFRIIKSHYKINKTIK